MKLESKEYYYFHIPTGKPIYLELASNYHRIHFMSEFHQDCLFRAKNVMEAVLDNARWEGSHLAIPAKREEFEVRECKVTYEF